MTAVCEGRWKKARRGILENTVAKLQCLVFAAIETLERNLSCENPAAEIRCAAIVPEQSMRGVEMLEIEGRIEMLEALVKRKKKMGKFDRRVNTIFKRTHRFISHEDFCLIAQYFQQRLEEERLNAACDQKNFLDCGGRILILNIRESLFVGLLWLRRAVVLNFANQKRRKAGEAYLYQTRPSRP